MANMARAMGAMGATFRGAQKLLGTIKIFIYSFLNLYFEPRTTINCEATLAPISITTAL